MGRWCAHYLTLQTVLLVNTELKGKTERQRFGFWFSVFGEVNASVKPLNVLIHMRGSSRADVMFCSFLSVQHYRITIELSGSVSGLSLLIDVCSALISFTMQPFVLMAATTSSCSTRKGSVPEMCTPSSWRWPMRKYDLWPLWRLAITQPVFSPFTLLSLEEAGEVPLALVRISTDSVKEHQMEGGQRKKEKHRFGETPHSKHEHMEALTGMQT